MRKILLGLLLAWDLAVGHSLLKITDELEMHVLDIGQGDAILLVTPEEHHILVDGGPGNAVLTELAEEIPYLFPKIDLMILTHPHVDHVEGLIWVLQRFEVGAVLMSAPAYNSSVYDAFLEELDGVDLYMAEAGTDFAFGDVSLNVLFPFESMFGEEVENINNVSPVIRVEYGENSILLMGDAEEEVEAVLVDVDVAADVLKAGHHGSRTSSGREFLEKVDPDLMVISAGVGNAFGHPHEETLEKASELSIEVLRTDLDGRISLSFDGQSWHRDCGVFLLVFRNLYQCN